MTKAEPSWSIGDFALIWLGGLLGSFLFVAVAPAGDDWSVVLSLAGQYIGNVAVFAYLARRKGSAAVGFTIETTDIAYIGLGLFLQIVLALLFRPLSNLLFPEGQPPQLISEAISDVDAPNLIRVSFFAAAVILAPITEELMFRGVLIKALAARGRWFIITVTAAAFSTVHVLGLDPGRILASAAVVLPPVFILGVVLAWVTLRNGRLGPAIFIHSGWNLLAAIVLLIPTELLDSVT